MQPPDLPPAVGPWIAHLASIEEKAEAGCMFRLTDLTEEEWRGRALLKQARERLSRRYKACPGCGKAILRLMTGHDLCGWKEER